MTGEPDNVFSDSRGEIRKYNVEGTKFNVLTTKAGAYRSGDVHPVTQFDLILEGKFEITTKENGKDVKKTYKKNDLARIPPNTPHLFKAIEDSVMIEWWDGEFSTEYYEPYRKIVEESMK